MTTLTILNPPGSPVPDRLTELGRRDDVDVRIVTADRLGEALPGTEGLLLWGYFSASEDESSSTDEDSPTNGATHVLVVNLEHGKEITRTIVGPGALEEFDPQARQWSPVSDGSRAELTLVAGGGRLLRLQTDD